MIFRSKNTKPKHGHYRISLNFSSSSFSLTRLIIISLFCLYFCDAQQNENYYDSSSSKRHRDRSGESGVYVATLSDVLLCLLCCFVWILWLVGSFFPWHVQELYVTKGVVVRGDVIDAYVKEGNEDMELVEGISNWNTSNQGNYVDTSIDTHRNSDGPRIMTVRSNVDGVVGGRDVPSGGNHYFSGNGGDAGYYMPSYHAVVCFVVPPKHKHASKVAQSPVRPKKPSPSFDHIALAIPSYSHDYDTTLTTPRQTHKKAFHSPTNSPDIHHLNTEIELPPVEPVSRKSTGTSHLSREVMPSLVDYIDLQDDNNENPQQNPIDHHLSIPKQSKDDDRPFMSVYDYNMHRSPKQKKSWGERLATYWCGPVVPEPLDKQTSPIRVTKRFDTQHLVRKGLRNIDVVVIPGDPTSGILKSTLDQQISPTNNADDYTEETGSDKRSSFERNLSKSSRKATRKSNELSAALGVVLALISTMGAVHAALQLPYAMRVWGWIILILSLTFMWPIATYTYGVIHRIRQFMMQRIISFEPCTSQGNVLYPQEVCAGGQFDGHYKNSNDYIITFDHRIKRNKSKQGETIGSPENSMCIENSPSGVDSESAVSSLSDNMDRGVTIVP